MFDFRIFSTHFSGAVTFMRMTHDIMTLASVTLSTMTLGIIQFIIMTLIKGAKHNDTQLNDTQ